MFIIVLYIHIQACEVLKREVRRVTFVMKRLKRRRLSNVLKLVAVISGVLLATFLVFNFVSGRGHLEQTLLSDLLLFIRRLKKLVSWSIQFCHTSPMIGLLAADGQWLYPCIHGHFRLVQLT